MLWNRYQYSIVLIISKFHSSAETISKNRLGNPMITFQLFIELKSRKPLICSAKQVTYIKLHVYMYFWFFTWEDLLLIKPAWGLPAWVICRTALTVNYRYPKTNPLICSRSSFIVPFIDLVECHFLGGGGNSFIFFFILKKVLIVANIWQFSLFV